MNFLQKLKATLKIQTEEDGPVGIIIIGFIPILLIFIPYGFYVSATDPNLNLDLFTLTFLFEIIALAYLGVIISYLNVLRKNMHKLNEIFGDK